MLDCSEVSIEKDPTIKNILAKYEHEIKVHVKMQSELKDIIKSNEVKLKDRDDTIKELHAEIEVDFDSFRDANMKSTPFKRGTLS